MYRQNYLRVSLLASILLTFIDICIAQEHNTKDSMLNEVVITSSKINGDAEIGTNFQTLDNKRISLVQGRTLPESFGVLPGLFIQKTNHGGGSPFLRGLTGNQTLTMIDDIRYNNSTYRYGPNQYINTIDIFTIENIQAQGGSGAVEYGTDALGGTLLFYTNEPNYSPDKNKFMFNVLGRIVSQDMEYSLRSEAQFSGRKFGILVGHTTRQFGDLYGGKDTGKQSPTGYRERDYNLKIKYKLSKTADLILNSQRVNQYDVPLFHKVKLENFQYNKFDPQSSQIHYARLIKTFENKFFKKIEFTTSIQNKKEQRVYKKNGTWLNTEEKDQVLTEGVTMKLSSNFTKFWSAKSGVEFYRDKVNSKTTKNNEATLTSEVVRGLYPDNSIYNSTSIYTIHYLKYRHLAMQAGTRYNAFNITIPIKEINNNEKIKLTPSSLVYNVGATYNFTNKHAFYASFNKGFRAPNIDDMGSLGIIDFRYEVPNYNLKPETSYQTEIGYRWVGEKIIFHASLYNIELQNLIARIKKEGEIINGYNVYIKENQQRARIRGVEFSFDYRLSKSFSFYTNGTYLQGQNKTANEPMRRIPPLNGRTILAYNRDRINTQLEFAYADKQDRLAKGDIDDNRIPKGGTPGWSVINIHASYELKWATLYVGLNNLLNKDYRMHGSGVNAMGRSIMATVQFGL
jgi:hemoglobin/transferrin/lactoferrin receptor protein